MVDKVKKILQVDDEPDITYIVEFVLANGGFDVVKLNDSTLAVKELLADEYSMLILDLMMPKMNGFEVLEKLRSEKSLKKLPVMILSSKQLNSDETELLRKNNAFVMTKPFEPHRLLEKIREILSASS